MTFGELLADLRSARGYSLRELAARAHCSHQTIHSLERGDGLPSPTLARNLDLALDADGTLEAAAAGHGGDDVQRRTMLRNIGLIGLASTVAASDAVRQGLAEALGRDTADSDGWEEVAAEYGLSFYTTDPGQLLGELTADLTLLYDRITVAKHAVRGSMCRAAGQLAAVAAMAWASTGETRRARHWWRTARQAADQSGCVETRMWVRGWEVADGLYEQRPIPLILERAAEADSVGGTNVSAGTAGMYAGLAQTLAVAGRKADALAALRRVADITDRLPARVVADEDSMFGWPEVRLRHTESYVYTALGETAAAYEAQDRALALYPEALVRERAAMLLHRSTCMVRAGDVAGGVAHATGVLDGLPAEHRTELVYAIGRQTLAALPATERQRTEATALAARLGSAA